MSAISLIKWLWCLLLTGLVWGLNCFTNMVLGVTITSCGCLITGLEYGIWNGRMLLSRLVLLSKCTWHITCILLFIYSVKLLPFHIYLNFTKRVHGYQLLQAFIVFMCENLSKNFRGCKAIHEKCEYFSPWMKSNIW